MRFIFKMFIESYAQVFYIIYWIDIRALANKRIVLQMWAFEIIGFAGWDFDDMENGIYFVFDVFNVSTCVLSQVEVELKPS